MYDVVIVGGSVAGCASALSLSQQGLQVLLLERAKVGRDKACGEGLLPAGVAALSRLGAKEAAHRAFGQPFFGVGFSFEGALAQSLFPNGHALGVRRALFDQALFSLAAASPNVTTREQCHVEGLLFSATGAIEGVQIRGGEKIGAPLVVGADGLSSLIRKSAGLDIGLPRQKRYGIRVHFALQNALPFGPFVRVLLDPPGEFYFTPVGQGQLQVAFLGEDLTARGFHKQTYAQKVMEHPKLKEIFMGAEVMSEVMGAGPFARSARSVVKDGLALVGDAAGYVDAVTGEGMELALRSAEVLGPIVARALSHGGPTQQNLSPYIQKREEIVRDPERLTRLVLLLERFPALARRAIPALNKRPQLFQKLLSVQGGEAPLSSLSVRDWLGLLGI